MRKLEEAKIYNCSTKFTITDCDAGWTDIECDFSGKKINFKVSYVGEQPTALLEVAYLLNSKFDNYTGLLHIEVDDDETVVDQEGNEGWTANLGASFQWDEEPRLNDWHISFAPKDFAKEDFDLTIDITRSTGEGEDNYSFIVPYRDFCYAVAKCFTDALKKYGHYGYGLGTYTDHIVVKQLLVVKAYALGLLSTRISASLDVYDPYDLSFEDELKLLAIEM